MRQNSGLAVTVVEDLPAERGLRRVRPWIGSQQVSQQAEWKVSDQVQLLRWYS